MTTIPPHHDITQRTMLIEGDEPRSHRSACLVVIHGEGIGRRIDLVDEPVVIGRSQDADFLLAHASVSRRHCRAARTSPVAAACASVFNAEFVIVGSVL